MNIFYKWAKDIFCKHVFDYKVFGQAISQDPDKNYAAECLKCGDLIFWDGKKRNVVPGARPIWAIAFGFIFGLNLYNLANAVYWLYTHQGQSSWTYIFICVMSLFTILMMIVAKRMGMIPPSRNPVLTSDNCSFQDKH